MLPCPLQISKILFEMKTQYIKKNEDGTFYYLDEKLDRLHREDGPAFESVCGSRFWYSNGLTHRTDGPAIEYADGSRTWYVNGQLHREDGPAIEEAGGLVAYYLNDEELSKEEWEKRVTKKTININGKAFTIEELNALIASVK